MILDNLKICGLCSTLLIILIELPPGSKGLLVVVHYMSMLDFFLWATIFTLLPLILNISFFQSNFSSNSQLLSAADFELFIKHPVSPVSNIKIL